jgi:hypothetical protein
MKFIKSRRGASEQVIVFFIIAILVVLAFLLFFPKQAKETSNSLIDLTKGTIDEAVGNIDVPDLNVEGGNLKKSSDDIIPTIGRCERLDINSFNKYKPTIDDAVRESGLANTIAGSGFAPDLLMASLISQESAWKENAVSSCGSAGIAQFTPATARVVGLQAPVYDFVLIASNACLQHACSGRGVTQISECNSCVENGTRCKSKEEDERFNPQKAILASAKYLKGQIATCRSVNTGVQAYNSGNCQRAQVDTNDKQLILGTWYPRWAACRQEGKI